MQLPRIVLLPGLDGTGQLFEPLLRVIPRRWTTHVVTYPQDQCLDYSRLLQHVRTQISCDDARLVLLAESFGGPLAVMYAAAHPDRVAAIVLSASFVCPPRRKWSTRLIQPDLFRLPLHQIVIRFVLAGINVPDALVEKATRAVKCVPPKVLAFRMRQTLTVDCQEPLRNVTAPLLYLQATRDALVGHTSLKRILKIRPDTIVRRLPAYHMLLQTVPSQAWREIEPFLNRYAV